MVVAAVLGGSGNVGRSLVQQLLQDASGFTKVVLIGRRELSEYTGNAIVEQHVVDTNSTADMEAQSRPALAGVDVAFVTFGVGASSKASREGLMHIDVDIPTAFARAARSAGVKHVSLLSAAGADITQSYSRITRTGAGGGYCNHVKGLVEANITDLSFPHGVSIIRPATIMGNSNTPGVWQLIAPKLDWALPKRYQSIRKEAVAQAMINAAAAAVTSPPKSESVIYEGAPLFALVDRHAGA